RARGPRLRPRQDTAGRGGPARAGHRSSAGLGSGTRLAGGRRPVRSRRSRPGGAVGRRAPGRRGLWRAGTRPPRLRPGRGERLGRGPDGGAGDAVRSSARGGAGAPGCGRTRGLRRGPGRAWGPVAGARGPRRRRHRLRPPGGGRGGGGRADGRRRCDATTPAGARAPGRPGPPGRRGRVRRRRAVGRAPRDPGGALGVRFGRAGRRTVARRGWPPPAPGRDRRRGARRGRAAMTVGDESTAEVPADLVDRVRARLAGLGVEPEPDEVGRAVRAEAGALAGHPGPAGAGRLVRGPLGGGGPLEALLASPGVTDVVVDGPGPALVDRGAGLETTDV